MTTEHFRLPDIGEGIAEAEIIEWLVAVGDVVAEHDVLVCIETDKSQVELPSPLAGTVTALRGGPGDRVQVGEILVDIESSADVPAIADPPASALPPAPSSAPSTAPDRRTRARTLASPRARRLAVRRGVDLDQVVGSGPHGRVLVADIEGLDPSGTTSPGAVRAERPADGPPPAALPTRPGRETVRIPLRGLRRRIAESMTASLAVPQILEFKEVDATKLLAAHRVLKAELAKQDVRLSVLPLLMMATIRALRMHPSLNATYDAEIQEIAQSVAVHLGMATATEDGLIVPVLRDADQMDLRTLSLAIDAAANSARTRTATSEQLASGTFSVTNFGSFGSWLGTPIIRPPEVGIAGFGQIADKVIAVDGAPQVRPVLPLVVAVDHRVNDGAHLGAFVADLAAAVSEPTLLLV